MAMITRIAETTGLAGQTQFTATVVYPDEGETYVDFVGAVGMVGPVVMITGQHNTQTFVTNPGRFGPFGKQWVRNFIHEVEVPDFSRFDGPARPGADVDLDPPERDEQRRQARIEARVEAHNEAQQSAWQAGYDAGVAAGRAAESKGE